MVNKMITRQENNPNNIKIRPRRIRISSNMRKLTRETKLTTSDLIYPLFIRYGDNEEREIKSMPGQKQLSVDRLPKENDNLIELGIPAIILIGIPETRGKEQ